MRTKGGESMTVTIRKHRRLFRRAVLSVLLILTFTAAAQAAEEALAKLENIAEQIAADLGAEVETTRAENLIVVFSLQEEDGRAFLAARFAATKRGVSFQLAFVDNEGSRFSSRAPLYTMKMSSKAKSARKALWDQARKAGLNLEKSKDVDFSLFSLAASLAKRLAPADPEQVSPPDAPSRPETPNPARRG